METQTNNNQPHNPTPTATPRLVLRTLNVKKSVGGITDDIHVSVAYRCRPGLTYTQARHFEERLQLKIQAALNECSFTKPAGAPYYNDDIRFIPIAEAQELTKHETRKGFYEWRLRHNRRHPKSKIILMRGCIELNSLISALQVYVGEGE